jgi:hypothetical protein
VAEVTSSNNQVDRDVRDVLPSFFAVLGEALRLEGRNDDAAMYEHDFGQNRFEAKIRYELRAREAGDAKA